MENNQSKHNVRSGFKLSSLLIFISVIISITLIYKFSHNENDILPARNRNRYPTLQRRNAMTEKDIDKILKKLEKVSENVRKNLK